MSSKSEVKLGVGLALKGTNEFEKALGKKLDLMGKNMGDRLNIDKNAVKNLSGMTKQFTEMNQKLTAMMNQQGAHTDQLIKALGKIETAMSGVTKNMKEQTAQGEKQVKQSKKNLTADQQRKKTLQNLKATQDEIFQLEKKKLQNGGKLNKAEEDRLVKLKEQRQTTMDNFKAQQQLLDKMEKKRASIEKIENSTRLKAETKAKQIAKAQDELKTMEAQLDKSNQLADAEKSQLEIIRLKNKERLDSVRAKQKANELKKEATAQKEQQKQALQQQKEIAQAQKEADADLRSRQQAFMQAEKQIINLRRQELTAMGEEEQKISDLIEVRIRDQENLNVAMTPQMKALREIYQLESDIRQHRQTEKASIQEITQANQAVYKIRNDIVRLEAKQQENAEAMTAKEREKLQSAKAKLPILVQQANKVMEHAEAAGIINDEYRKRIQKMDQIASHQDAITQASTRAEQAQNKINNLMDEYKKNLEQASKLRLNMINKSDQEVNVFKEQIATIETRNQKIVNSLNDSALFTSELKTQLNLIKQQADAKFQLARAQKEVKQTAQQTVEVKGMSIVAMNSKFMMLNRLYNQMLTPVKALNDGLINMTRVLDDSDAMISQAVDNFESNMFRQANAMGVLVDSYIEATRKWIVAGFDDINEYGNLVAEELARITSMAYMISPDVANAQTMQKYLHVVKNSFMETGDQIEEFLQDFINGSNQIANEFPVTMDAIGNAMQRMAVSAQNAGMSWQQATAMASTAINQTQLSGERVGTAMNSLFTRTAQIAGEFTGAMREQHAELQRLGVSVVDASGEMYEFEDILRQVQRAFNDTSYPLNNLERQTVLNILAGQSYANILGAIVDGLDEYSEMLDIIDGQAGLFEDGSAWEEHSRMMNTINAQWNQLQNLLIDIWWEFSDGGQMVVDIIKTTIGVFEQLRAVVSNPIFQAFIQRFVIPLTAVTVSTQIMNMVSQFTGLSSVFSNLFDFVRTGFPNMITNIGAATTASGKLKAVWSGMKVLMGPKGWIGLGIAGLVTLGNRFNIFGREVTESGDRLARFEDDIRALSRENVLLNGDLKETTTTLKEMQNVLDEGLEGEIRFSQESFDEFRQDIVDLGYDMGIEIDIETIGFDNAQKKLDMLKDSAGYIRDISNEGISEAFDSVSEVIEGSLDEFEAAYQSVHSMVQYMNNSLAMNLDTELMGTMEAANYIKDSLINDINEIEARIETGDFYIFDKEALDDRKESLALIERQIEDLSIASDNVSSDIIGAVDTIRGVSDDIVNSVLEGTAGIEDFSNDVLTKVIPAILEHRDELQGTIDMVIKDTEYLNGQHELTEENLWRIIQTYDWLEDVNGALLKIQDDQLGVLIECEDTVRHIYNQLNYAIDPLNEQVGLQNEFLYKAYESNKQIVDAEGNTLHLNTAQGKVTGEVENTNGELDYANTTYGYLHGAASAWQNGQSGVTSEVNRTNAQLVTATGTAQGLVGWVQRAIDGLRTFFNIRNTEDGNAPDVISGAAPPPPPPAPLPPPPPPPPPPAGDNNHDPQGNANAPGGGGGPRADRPTRPERAPRTPREEREARERREGEDRGEREQRERENRERREQAERDNEAAQRYRDQAIELEERAARYREQERQYRLKGDFERAEAARANADAATREAERARENEAAARGREMRSRNDANRNRGVNEDIWRHWALELDLSRTHHELTMLAHLMQQYRNQYEQLIPLLRQQETLLNREIQQHEQLRGSRQSEMDDVLRHLRGWGFQMDGNNVTNLGRAQEFEGDDASEVQALLNQWRNIYGELQNIDNTIASTQNRITEIQRQLEMERLQNQLNRVNATLQSIANQDAIFGTMFRGLGASDVELGMAVQNDAMRNAQSNVQDLIREFNQLSTVSLEHAENAEEVRARLEELSDAILNQTDNIVAFQMEINRMRIDRIVNDLDSFNNALSTNRDRINQTIDAVQRGLVSGTDINDLLSAQTRDLDFGRDNEFTRFFQDRINMEQQLQDALNAFGEANVERTRQVANAELQIHADMFNRILQMQNDFQQGNVSHAVDAIDREFGLGGVGDFDDNFNMSNELGEMFQHLQDRQNALREWFASAMDDATSQDERDGLANEFIRQNLLLQQEWFEAEIAANNRVIEELMGELESENLTGEQRNQILNQIRDLEDANITAQGNIMDSIERRMDFERQLLQENIDRYNEYFELLNHALSILDAINNQDLNRQLDILEDMFRLEQSRNNELQNTIRDLERQQALLEEGSLEWNLINEQLSDFNSQLQDSDLALLGQNQAILESRFANIFDQLERNIFNGMNLDEWRQWREDWVEGIERERELEEMYNRIADLNAENLRDEFAILERQERLSREQLRYLNAQLDLVELQRRLEDVRNQRTMRTMVQRADGTFGVDWTYDHDLAEEIEREISQQEQEIENMREEAQINFTNRLQQILQQGQNGQFETVDEMRDAIYDLKDLFGGILGDDFFNSIGGNIDDILDAFEEFLENQDDVVGNRNELTPTNIGRETANAIKESSSYIGRAMARELEGIFNKLTPTGFSAPSINTFASNTPTNSTISGDVINHFTVNASFDSLTDAQDIKRALESLGSKTLQNKYKK